MRNIQLAPCLAQLLDSQRATHRAKPFAHPFDRDHKLEQQIDAAYERMIHAPSTVESTAAFYRMAELQRRRSDAQINRMEHAMGLAW